MGALQDTIFYVLSFLSLYLQVFLLITFLDRKEDILIRRKPIKLKHYPSVTIIVPCYNEQGTIRKTVRSLLNLDYPMDKLDIILVDDGSTDGTFTVLKSFSDIKNIRVIQKENGGKHTAINLGLELTKTELVGGLDSDSFVHKEALKRIVSYFTDKETMAVCPSIIVHEPKNFLQKAQKAEYDMSIYTKKMLAFLGGIHVTPGPFSIFRKSVFDTLGPYTKAHNTEDQEIALRMHYAGYKIEHCPDAYVYTITPNTLPKLYRQRLRWLYGFIRNAVDYRKLWLRPKYGTVGILTLPFGMVSLWSLLFLFTFLLIQIIDFVKSKILKVQAVGWEQGAGVGFEWFYMKTGATIFILIAIYSLVTFGLLIGRRMSGERMRLKASDIYFVLVYRLFAPLWIMKAMWNSVWSKESSWTNERKVK